MELQQHEGLKFGSVLLDTGRGFVTGNPNPTPTPNPDPDPNPNPNPNPNPHPHPHPHPHSQPNQVGDKDAESEAILHEHEVNSAPFSAQVQACLPEKGWQIPSDEIAKRLDLRNGRALVRAVAL